MLGIYKKILLGIGLFLLIFGGWLFFSSSKTGGEKPQKNPTSPNTGMKTFTIEPTEEHTATFIFLHGLGDSASNWQNNYRPIAKNYPNVKFIFPQSHVIPISMNCHWPSAAWYNVKGSIRKIRECKPDKEGLLKSVAKIKKIIQEEINSGIKLEKIIVGGFSQGASVALAVGLTTDYQLGGITCLSGFLPCREEIFSWTKEINQNRFHLYHGYYDNLIPYDVGEETNKLIAENGYFTQFNSLNFDGHIWPQWAIEAVSEEELKNLQ